MPSRGIAHAWTVIADKVGLDSRTNNFILFTVEQMRLAMPPLPKGVKGALVKGPIEVVSLWYRVDHEKPSRGEGRLRLVGPDGDDLAFSEQSIDLTSVLRVRSQATFPSLPVSREGTFHVVTELKVSGAWKEVSRVPLDMKVDWIAVTASPGSGGQPDATLTDASPASPPVGDGGKSKAKHRAK